MKSDVLCSLVCWFVLSTRKRKRMKRKDEKQRAYVLLSENGKNARITPLYDRPPRLDFGSEERRKRRWMGLVTS